MYTTGRFILDGKEIDAPIEAVSNVGETGIFIEASFGVENVQPAITPLSFTFPNEAAKIIRDYIQDGNIFEGMNFSADVIGDAGTVEAINGFLDLTDGYEELNDVQVKANAKFKQSTLSLEDQIASLTLDLLREEGALTDGDYTGVPYVVEKPINLVEIAIITVTLYLMTKELAESVEKLSTDVNTVIALLTPTPPATAPTASAIVFQVGQIVIRLAYTTVMLVAIIDLMTDLLKQFISPVRNLKGLKYIDILTKGFDYLGYDFESDIKELNNYVYVPSIPAKPNENGVPSAQDYGYNFGEMVALIRKQFNAKIAVVNNTIQFKSENSPYWLKTSSYQMPDVLLDENNPKGFNTEELVKSRIIQYQLDNSDNWTLDNYKGTQYTVITQHTNQVSEQLSGLKGFEYIQFPVALGNRKEGLNLLEEALKILAKSADIVMGAFGSNKNFAQQIENRVGMLKVEREETSIPKCIYLSGGSIPKNHRDLTSSKYLWDNYINEKSFVDNDFKRQRIFYSGVEFGFGLSDFLKVITNSYFYTESGAVGKFVNIKWDWESDLVIADFWIEQVYTKKLKQLEIETP